VRLFKDELLTEPLEKAEFGEVWLLEAKTLKVWLSNNTKAFLRDIQVDAGAEAPVKVDAPRSLQSMAKAPITFTWQPTLLKGLKLAVTVHAVEVYSA
jgi:hypothetical protein